MKNLSLPMFFTLLLAMILSACNLPIIEADSTVVISETTAAEAEIPQPADATPTAAAPATQPAAPTETTAPEEPAGQNQNGWVAFLGVDGNIWFVDQGSGEHKQITMDAASIQSGSESTVTYCCMQWSSDGALLAFMRETGKPVSWGMEFQTELWVYDLSADAHQQVLADTRVNGYAWQPGAHVIAYAPPIDEGYFISRKKQSAELAVGIWGVNVEDGSTYELVKPERGYALARPQWSPDGRYITFGEVLHMAGLWQFAYYDLQEQQYAAWEQGLGSFAWSPDGTLFAYDSNDFSMQNTGQIWMKEFPEGTAQALSPDYTPGYASHPVFSPNGEYVAYFVNITGEEMGKITLFVAPISGGEAVSLGEFIQLWDMHWSADSRFFIFSAGVYDQQQVYEMSVSDASLRVLANGSYAIPQP